jgi:hypothetical protein
MRRAFTAIIVAAIASASMVGSAFAYPIDDDPVRMAMAPGDRVSFVHEGPMCWRWSRNDNGRPRAIIVQGERRERGAPCRGARTAIVRLPWDSTEEAHWINIWATPGKVHVMVMHYD